MPLAANGVNIYTDWANGRIPIFDGTNFIEYNPVTELVASGTFANHLTAVDPHPLYLTHVSGDQSYLRLDASNDPITGPLQINGNLTVGGVVSGVGGIFINRNGSDPYFHLSKDSVPCCQLRGFDDGVYFSDSAGTQPGYARISSSGIATPNIYTSTALYYAGQNTDARYESSGTLVAHLADAGDPHGQYLTHVSGDLSYVPLSRTISTPGIGLTGGGTLSSNLDLYVDFTEVQASGNYVTRAYGDILYAPSGNYEISGTTHSFTNLTDVDGTWTSGQLARYDGVDFKPYILTPSVGDTAPTANKDWRDRNGIIVTSGGIDYYQVCLSGTAGYSWQTIAIGDQ